MDSGYLLTFNICYTKKGKKQQLLYQNKCRNTKIRVYHHPLFAKAGNQGKIEKFFLHYV